MGQEQPSIEKTSEVEKEKELERLNKSFLKLVKEKAGKSLGELDYEEIIRIGEEFKQLPEVKNFEARYGELTPISPEEFTSAQKVKREKGGGLSKKKRLEEGAKEYWGEDMWKLSEYYRRSEGAKKGWEKRKEGEKTFAEEAAEEEQKRAAEAKVMMGEELPEEAAAAEEDIETLKKKTREEYEKAGFKFEYKKEPEKKYRRGPQRELWIDKVGNALIKGIDKMADGIAISGVAVEKGVRHCLALGLKPAAIIEDFNRRIFAGPRKFFEKIKMRREAGKAIEKSDKEELDRIFLSYSERIKEIEEQKKKKSRIWELIKQIKL